MRSRQSLMKLTFHQGTKTTQQSECTHSAMGHPGRGEGGEAVAEAGQALELVQGAGSVFFICVTLEWRPEWRGRASGGGVSRCREQGGLEDAPGLCSSKKAGGLERGRETRVRSDRDQRRGYAGSFSQGSKSIGFFFG